MITERQAEILNKIVQEYIKLAKPISSEFLERKYSFGISPATIRIEMQKLTEKGYLFQPHISAGRVPTDKGFRFFVDKLLEREIEEIKIEKFFKGLKMKDEFLFFQNLTKKLAQISKSLVLSYLEKKIIWKEGWEEILKEPEFKSENLLSKFTKILKKLETKIKNLKLNSEIKIYIGRENPIKRIEYFSLIVVKCNFRHKKETIFSLFGPVRMNYNRNISLLKSTKKFLENF